MKKKWNETGPLFFKASVSSLQLHDHLKEPDRIFMQAMDRFTPIDREEQESQFLN